MSLKGYKTVLREARDEVVIHKSRFIGHAAPVSSTEEALRFLARIREEHRDATHNCYAYIIGRNAGIMRYSDDGEPSGTAGMPIIEVMKARGVVDCAVVVTRYFGGILLGAGGLTRAYANGAALAVAAAERITYRSCADCRIEMAYPRYGLVSRLLPDYEAQVLASSFGERVGLTVRLPEEQFEELRAALTEATAGAVEAEFLQKIFAAL